MLLLAQNASGFEAILDKLGPDELVPFCAIAVVFGTGLLVVITVCVTSMISSIRIASINARLVERLAEQGMSPEEIEQVVKTSVLSDEDDRGCRKIARRGAWRRAEQPLPTERPHKPTPMRT